MEWVLRKRSEIWLQDVDFVCITDGQWLGNRKPCLSYGARFASCVYMGPLSISKTNYCTSHFNSHLTQKITYLFIYRTKEYIKRSIAVMDLV